MPARHAYGASRSQHAALLVPEGPGPFGVVVLIHGGFWRAGFNRGIMNPLADDLAARGWGTWNLEYRRLGVGWGAGGGWPATFDDVAAAIDLLAGVDAPLDLDRVVAVGHSAGGHLALWAAARPGLPDDAPGANPRVRLAGAVSQAGVTDLRAACEQHVGGGVVRRLLGGAPGGRRGVGDRYDVASPIERVPLGIPQLLVHGEKDLIVPPAFSIAYADAARAAGDADVTVVVRPGEGHFEHIDAGSEAWAGVVSWLEARFR